MIATLNRILLAALFFAVAALAVALAVATPAVVATIEALLAGLRAAPSTTLLVGAAAVAALAFLLGTLEVWPQPGPAFEAEIEGGTAAYSAETVSAALARDLVSLEGVRSVRPMVSGRRQVDVQVNVYATPGAAPHDLAARVASRVRDTLERDLGLKVGRVRVALLGFQSEPAGAPPATSGRAATPASSAPNGA